MALLTGEITRDGAVVGLLIEVSHRFRQTLVREGKPVPPPQTVRAVIDTGSNATGFVASVLRPLGIKPVGRVPILTPSTTPNAPHFVDRYEVSLTLVSGEGSTLVIPSVFVVAPEEFDHTEDIQGLIGRDLLNRCVFEYWGPEKSFRLAFIPNATV